MMKKFKLISWLMLCISLFSCERTVKDEPNSIKHLSIENIVVDGARCTVYGNVEWQNEEGDYLWIGLNMLTKRQYDYHEYIHVRNGMFSVTFKDVFPNQLCNVVIEYSHSGEVISRVFSEQFFSSMHFIMDRIEFNPQNDIYLLIGKIHEEDILCVPYITTGCTVTFYIEDMSGSIVWQRSHQGDSDGVQLTETVARTELKPNTEYSCYYSVEPYNYPICRTERKTFVTVE